MNDITDATSTPLLKVEGLSAGYGQIQILSDVSLEVRRGEIIALLGSNGAGKTTLNNAMVGTCKRMGGSVHFDGRDISRSAPELIVDCGLIHVPEGRRIFPNLSIQDNLELGSYRRGRANRARNLEEVFDTFPRLKERRRQLAGSLSGGEQQMLAIGRGMMSEPVLLILDEPSLGLSPLLVDQMFELIVRLNEKGQSILLVEQNAAQSLQISHRAYVMENGRLVASGLAADLAADPALRRAYLGL